MIPASSPPTRLAKASVMPSAKMMIAACETRRAATKAMAGALNALILSSAIESTANSLASKDPDELIEDTRNFVRNSPGVAIAGAAIVGFVVARLFKSGLASNRDDDEA